MYILGVNEQDYALLDSFICLTRREDDRFVGQQTFNVEASISNKYRIILTSCNAFNYEIIDNNSAFTANKNYYDFIIASYNHALTINVLGQSVPDDYLVI